MAFGSSQPELMPGAKNAVETCLAVQPGEHVALIADAASSAAPVERFNDGSGPVFLGPVARWNRRWDGRWRLALFDVPETRTVVRNRLRRYLQSRGFGYLQNSVWITPDPIREERALLAEGPVDVESLILLEARPCAGETDAQIVAGAWNFADLNERYAVHQRVLTRRPRRHLLTTAAATAFHRWFGEEREAWLDALRLEILTEAGEQMRAFEPPEGERQ